MVGSRFSELLRSGAVFGGGVGGGIEGEGGQGPYLVDFEAESMSSCPGDLCSAPGDEDTKGPYNGEVISFRKSSRSPPDV